MKIQSMLSRCCAAFLAVSIFLPGNLSAVVSTASTAGLTAGKTFVVNTTLDTPNADASLGICADAAGRCSLRAAVQVANFVQGADTIVLPAGTFTLTRPGLDDGALVGDLDITDDLTIQGAGSGASIVDGNGAVTGDRVFQILSTVKNVSMTGIDIRNGQSPTVTSGITGGGGIEMEGAGHLLLSDVIFDGNKAQNGGGLFANFTAQGGSLEMDHVIVRNNTVTAGGVGAGGGVFASLLSGLSTITVQDSQVDNNTADGTGGGFFVSGTDLGHWQILRSEIDSNTAASGGGIGNFFPLTMSDSQLNGNHVTVDGGAIEAFSPLSISRTTMDSNTAARYGGGIFSLATGSSALYNDFLNIQQSTLSHNSAQDGGGIYHDGYINYPSLLTLTNSTLSGNGASRYGGGLNLYNAQADLFNTTIANNMIYLKFPNPGPGTGGGLYVTIPAVLTAEDSLIADNKRGNGIIVGTEDDCYSVGGTTGTLGFDLILSTTNCFVTGAQVGVITGKDPLLGPLEYNGGSTATQALLPGSPAIDAGATLGCMDAGGAPLTTDQRGYQRPYGQLCDIGAYEYNPNNTRIFLPVLLK